MLFKNSPKTHQNIRNYYNNSSCNFIETIKYIYIIYRITQNNLLNSITLQILQKYKKAIQSKEIKQYIKKFTHLYFVKYEYYFIYKSLNYTYKINIDEIAILNLYIIKNLQNKKGVRFLIKYLSS